MSDPESPILDDGNTANQDVTTDAISSIMTENDQITLSVAQLKQLIEANSNIASVNNVASLEQEPVADNLSDDPLSSDEECDVTAPEVEAKLAQFVDNRLVTPQSKEKLQIKFNKATRPSNIENTREVRINNTLFKSLSLSAKKRDSELRKIHDMCTKAVNNIVKAADVVIKKGKHPGDKAFTESEFRELHSNIVNGLGLVCQSAQKINCRRVRSYFVN